ncbi:MAG: Gfo/Idh/MocA family oxidoreductase, partial [Balneolaceae bacterium]
DAIRSTEYGKLVAAHNRTRAKLEAFCGKYGLEDAGYTDFHEFLSHPGLDIVVICTPSGTHLDVGQAAAEAGKHVIVEKPIEVSLERGRRLINNCRTHGVELAVIYQNRFIEEVIEMKKAIDDGKAGKPFMVDVSVKLIRDQDYYDRAAWRGSLSLDGGGAVINQAIHTVDLMLWFMGDIESLFAYKGTFTHEGIEGEDNAVAALQFKNGAIGVFRASTSIVPPGQRKIDIHGPKGTAVLNGDEFRLLSSEKDPSGVDDSVQSAGASSPLAGMTANHHKKQYDQILYAFRHGEDPVVSGEESLKSLAVVKAIYESSEKRELVILDEFLSGAETGQEP